MAGEEYEPVAIHRTEEGHLYVHSQALNLDLCWENGQLRFWDPVSRLYLNTYLEEREARIAEHGALLAEREARIAAEAHVRELQEELSRLRGE